jgi:hypothetical protein
MRTNERLPTAGDFFFSADRSDATLADETWRDAARAY